MKKYWIGKISLMLCLVLGLFLAPICQLGVWAAEVTVEGTVLAGTTSDLLKLDTSDGYMEIKLDSTTDTSECKILITGEQIRVTVTGGSDKYLHAVKVTGSARTNTITVDQSSVATIIGILNEKSMSSLLFFDTAQGEMQIKLDETTDMNGCSVLVSDRTYKVVCARGSDAYMHAISIADSTESVTAASALKTGAGDAASEPALPSGTVTYMEVAGTVNSSTKESLLYLNTAGGVMQFKIDSNAETGEGMVLTTGRTLTVKFYHGTDGYLHAVKTKGVRTISASAQIDSNTATVSGTVRGASDENYLYLYTPQGEMILKLDAVKSLNNCKVLVSGKEVTVTCARGSDAYMHALSITGK